MEKKNLLIDAHKSSIAASLLLFFSFHVTDFKGRQRVDPAGLPEGGGAADGAPAPAHRAILRRLYGRRAAGHGVRIHEARRPQPIS